MRNLQKILLFIIPICMFFLGFVFNNFLKEKEIQKIKIETNRIRIANLELEENCHNHEH